MYEEQLKLPKGHQLKEVSFKNENRKGHDTDFYEFEEIDTQGNILSKYYIESDTCIYPPQNQTTTFSKYDLEGNKIESGTL